MIKSDAERERTVAQIEGFRQALAKVDQGMTGRRAAAIRGSYDGMIGQLENEIREYDELKSGDLALPNVERLDQIAPFVTKLRIANPTFALGWQLLSWRQKIPCVFNVGTAKVGENGVGEDLASFLRCPSLACFC